MLVNIYDLLYFKNIQHHISLALPHKYAIIYKSHFNIGVWLSLVERVVRDYEAAGSNPVTSTTSFKSNNNISRCGSAW